MRILRFENEDSNGRFSWFLSFLLHPEAASNALTLETAFRQIWSQLLIRAALAKSPEEYHVRTRFLSSIFIFGMRLQFLEKASFRDQLEALLGMSTVSFELKKDTLFMLILYAKNFRPFLGLGSGNEKSPCPPLNLARLFTPTELTEFKNEVINWFYDEDFRKQAASKTLISPDRPPRVRERK